jgi:hypothetical protein
MWSFSAAMSHMVMTRCLTEACGELYKTPFQRQVHISVTSEMVSQKTSEQRSPHGQIVITASGPPYGPNQRDAVAEQERNGGRQCDQRQLLRAHAPLMELKAISHQAGV